MKISTRLSLVFTGVVLLAACPARASVLSYVDTATFVGVAPANGGATSANMTTNLVGDDLMFAAGLGGRTFDGVAVVIYNPDASSAITFNFHERFFADDGANAGPGTLLGTINTIPFTLAANSAALVGITNITAAQEFTVPANGHIWAGIFFDNSGGTPATTAAQLNELSLLLYNPPQIGSSADRDFAGAGPGTYLTNNPTGTLRTAPYGAQGRVANYGWQLSVADVVPEPSSLVFMAAGAAGLGSLVLRRRSRAVR